MKKTSRIISVIALCALMLFMTACGGKRFEHGTTSGTTYTSKFLGLKADFGSGCMFTSDDILAMAFNIPDMSAENIQKAFEKTGAITEMSVILAEGDSVSIAVYDRKKAGLPVGDEYFDSAKQKLLEENIPVSLGTVDFLGKSTRCIEYSITVLGKTFYETEVPIFKGDYIAVVAFSSAQKSSIKPLIDRFTTV